MTAYRALSLVVGCPLVLVGCFASTDSEEVQTADEDSVEEATFAASQRPLGLVREGAASLAARRLDPLGRLGSVPSSLDLSSRFPLPGDQGAQSSCVGWATAYAGRSFHEAAEWGWSPRQLRYQFSPSWVYNQINSGIDGGARFVDAFNLLLAAGADSIDWFPYNDGDFTRQPSTTSARRAGKVRWITWGTIPTNNLAVGEIKSHVLEGDVVHLGVGVYPDFDSLSARNSVYDVLTGTSRGGHALTIVGWDDAISAFKFINSWGTGWGLGGYGWMSYELIANPAVTFEIHSVHDMPDPEVAPSQAAFVAGGNPAMIKAVDRDFGMISNVLSRDPYAPEGMTVIGNSLFEVVGGRLRVTNVSTGYSRALGGQYDWLGNPVEMADSGNELYMSFSRRLYRVDSSTGARTEIVSGLRDTVSGLTVHRGLLVALLKNGEVWSVDPANGSTRLLASGFASVRGGILSDGVFLWGLNSSFRLIRRADGGTITQMGSRQYSFPKGFANTVNSGRILLLTDDALHSINIVDGQPTQLGPSGSWRLFSRITA